MRRADISGRFKSSPVIVINRPNNSKRTKLLPRIFSASASFRFPRSMEKSGAPPMPTRLAKAMVIVQIGKATPRPVSALVESKGILPIKIRSIILYKTLINCVIGSARRSMCAGMLPVEKSFSAVGFTKSLLL